ncbi:hypothetical protein [Paraliomyxa miuraensis]|uniref:hypothetical protein n=1 Tax=Paraliomyxa miuraensis TaxID=376150 RepID=UPI002255E95A|nr:hypothetical protein [Paraliomyxa miuraensis]MCX4246126.1 hypothetical protein [Paraliomyxa miuraensis]
MRSRSIGVALLATGCFNPDVTPLQTEGSGTAEDTGPATDTGTACMAGQTQDCACADDSIGTQTCLPDGSGFGGCECGAVDTGSSTIDPTTGPPPECTDDADCAGMAEGECEQGVCGDDGTCSVQPLRAGTPCGDATEVACSGADSCDGAGTCSANDAPDGVPCSDCPLGSCACMGGACGDCTAFALQNDFITTRSIEGWQLTGGWGLYREAPQNFDVGPTVFGSQVFGTDGNRVAPYPSSETEQSSARTPPTILPPTLEFLSWNVDEGTGVDNKWVRVSTDGGASFTTLVDCNMGMPLPFCQFRTDRAPDDWDPITIPVPPMMVGQVGIVEFAYDTLDSCCNFEKGWYIDATNFATQCACLDDASCGGLGGECGTGVCGGTGECELDVVAAGTACGDATDVECNAADACDGLGYCAPNVAATGLTTCFDCPAGAGDCNVCQAGACPDCVSLPSVNAFSQGAQSFGGWVIEDFNGNGAGWQLYSQAPPNQNPGSVPVALSSAPAFGTDGNRQPPYPGAQDEHSRVTTTVDTVPPSITFNSWNVDEGSGVDNKIIELSVDGGATWNVLVNCGGGIGTPQPFCDFRSDGRLGNDWDSVTIPTGAFAGMPGQLRITYDTLDSCCEFERGWFIDNLNFAQRCQDSAFP